MWVTLGHDHETVHANSTRKSLCSVHSWLQSFWGWQVLEILGKIWFETSCLEFERNLCFLWLFVLVTRANTVCIILPPIWKVVLSIIRLFQLLMLPTFICLGWNFPCWVSPSGWISWERFHKNTWTIPGNEKRRENYILLMFIKVAASTWFRNHCTYVFWSRELNN